MLLVFGSYVITVSPDVSTVTLFTPSKLDSAPFAVSAQLGHVKPVIVNFFVTNWLEFTCVSVEDLPVVKLSEVAPMPLLLKLHPVMENDSNISTANTRVFFNFFTYYRFINV